MGSTVQPSKQKFQASWDDRSPEDRARLIQLAKDLPPSVDPDETGLVADLAAVLLARELRGVVAFLAGMGLAGFVLDLTTASSGYPGGAIFFVGGLSLGAGNLWRLRPRIRRLADYAIGFSPPAN